MYHGRGHACHRSLTFNAFNSAVIGGIFVWLLGDHVRSQRNPGLASPDSVEVARWLADRLPFAMEIPIFPEAQLKGARLVLVTRAWGSGDRGSSPIGLPFSSSPVPSPAQAVMSEASSRMRGLTDQIRHRILTGSMGASPLGRLKGSLRGGIPCWKKTPVAGLFFARLMSAMLRGLRWAV
jgi:hypothetical protein